ncbi:MAG: maleylpyruvate isomerase family protein [Acidobacteria bacterium]|nr:maleylpyruvate isomerase family protein [Acidobacteriota bacterium]
MSPERRLRLLERVTAAFAAEIDQRDPGAVVPWSGWPDVRALVGHLGGVHDWAAQVLRTGERATEPIDVPAPAAGARAWYLEQRSALLDAIRSVPPGASCWVFTGTDRTAGFWRRRMLFETAKHLSDLRASGGGVWRGVPELGVDGSADGIDELFEVFLARSRTGLADLPAPVLLEASDSRRRWAVRPDWAVRDDVEVPGASIVRACAADLALFVWDRADPLTDPDRFEVIGDRATIAAFRDAPIHA